ncbi:hypothetical protein [Cytobacillus sp. BC1816]|uniref:hypothetical protein n=1 Tax=Cytobacillus sp. BC1816 TaxID=3440154 RepID=UPI003F50DC94
MRRYHFLLIIQFNILMFCMFFYASKFHTYAWFTSEIKSSGQITNATTKDLLTISTSDITYHDNCKISQEIIIKNISDIKIPIKLVNNNKLLYPGESFQTSVKQNTSCMVNEVGYHLIGLNHYIDEVIQVPLNRDMLLATVSKTEEIEKEYTNNKAPEEDNDEKNQAESNQPPISDEEEKNDQTENDHGDEQQEQPVISNEKIDHSLDDRNERNEN